jgi:acetylglutamate kinase
MDIVEMVLAGAVNKEIVTLINQMGGKGVGLTGKDGGLILAKKLRGSRNKMGHVGEVKSVDAQILRALEGDRFIPVISPVGADEKGKSYNINADLVAGSLAAALSAEKFLILTDVPGILDGKKKLFPTLSKKEAQRLIKKGVIGSGMLPKVSAALSAIEKGVHKAHIIDGRVPHALLLEIFTDKGVGTEILA